MGSVGPKVKRSVIGWKWQNGYGPSSLGLQEAETKARIGGFGGRGAAVGDMNAWGMQSGRGVVLFSVLPIPSGRPQAPGFIIAFVASQLARAPKQRAQANDDGTAFIHDGRPPRSFLLVGCPNAIPPVISVISMEPSFFKSWAIYFPCLAQSSRFGGLENDSWSPISTACNGTHRPG